MKCLPKNVITKLKFLNYLITKKLLCMRILQSISFLDESINHESLKCKFKFFYELYGVYFGDDYEKSLSFCSFFNYNIKEYHINYPSDICTEYLNTNCKTRPACINQCIINESVQAIQRLPAFLPIKIYLSFKNHIYDNYTFDDIPFEAQLREKCEKQFKLACTEKFFVKYTLKTNKRKSFYFLNLEILNFVTRNKFSWSINGTELFVNFLSICSLYCGISIYRCLNLLSETQKIKNKHFILFWCKSFAIIAMITQSINLLLQYSKHEYFTNHLLKYEYFPSLPPISICVPFSQIEYEFKKKKI